MAAGSAVATVSCFIADGVAVDDSLAIGWVVGISQSCSHLRKLRCYRNTTRSVADIVSSCLDLSGVARHCSTVVGILPLSTGNLGSESQVVFASLKRCLDSNQADGTVPVWLEPS